MRVISARAGQCSSFPRRRESSAFFAFFPLSSNSSGPRNDVVQQMERRVSIRLDSRLRGNDEFKVFILLR